MIAMAPRRKKIPRGKPRLNLILPQEGEDWLREVADSREDWNMSKVLRGACWLLKLTGPEATKIAVEVSGHSPFGSLDEKQQAFALGQLLEFAQERLRQAQQKANAGRPGQGRGSG